MTFYYLLQIDEDATVGLDAFSRIAPAVPIISNVIISENLFEVLTTSTDGRLQFSSYDKYLLGLERYRSCSRRLTFYLNFFFVMIKMNADLAGCLSLVSLMFLLPKLWFLASNCVK